MPASDSIVDVHAFSSPRSFVVRVDSQTATWSKDARLFQDAPVWDDVGNLTVAYNKVQILVTDETVTLEGGGTITITNVPQPGRVDLAVTKRRLIKDVELRAGDFTVESANYLPGAAVTLSATCATPATWR